MICKVFTALFLLTAPAVAQDFGTVGKTYRIVEPDAVRELEDAAKKVKIDRGKATRDVLGFRPEEMAVLPRAKKDSVHRADMTAVLEIDVPDGKGGTLYPKGYRFNLLDHMAARNVFVMINGDDPKQVEWFKKSEFSRRGDVILMFAGGAPVDGGRKLKRRVFFFPKKLAERFQVAAVPAVAYQSGKVMEVRTYAIR